MKFWVRTASGMFAGRRMPADWHSMHSDLDSAKRECRSICLVTSRPSLVMQSAGLIRCVHTTSSCGVDHGSLSERCDQHNERLREAAKAKRDAEAVAFLRSQFPELFG